MIFTHRPETNAYPKQGLGIAGPPELISLPATLVPALLVLHTTGTALGAALAGTWGGNIGYFGTILLRDVGQTRTRYKQTGRYYGIHSFAKTFGRYLLSLA